ncbi:hypothetical protein [Stieleria maiorica]|nr:hypothetical protein [Stieleria maiorica]
MSNWDADALIDTFSKSSAAASRANLMEKRSPDSTTSGEIESNGGTLTS